MDQIGLLTMNVAAGAALLRALDAAEQAVDVAARVYDSDPESWRFYIHFSGSGDKRQLLTDLDRIIQSDPDVRDGLSILDVYLVRDHEALLKALKDSVHTGGGVNYSRVRSRYTAGVYIEDAPVDRARHPFVPSRA